MSTTEDHKELEIYEVGYSILTSVSEEKLGNVVAKIQKAITDEGGELLDSEPPFQQELAYSISKTIGARKYVADEAYIGWMKFVSTPEKTPIIKSALDKIDELLRFLLIKTTRETIFTYEGERKAKEDKEAQDRGDVEEVTPKETVTEEAKASEVALDEGVVSPTLNE